MKRLSVLLCSEGTYPFYEGGVSVWCDQLIGELSGVDFRVFAITPSPNPKTLAFELRPNVISLEELPLWGTEEPGQTNQPFSEIYKKRIRTTSGVIRKSFLADFRQLITCIMHGEQPEQLGKALAMLHLYFQRYDYFKTVSSRAAWETFLEVMQASHVCTSPTLHEATACMRWLQRFLGVLNMRFEETDITHTSIAGLAGVPGVLAKFLRGTPFLVSEHGIFLRELYLSLRGCGYTENCRSFLLAFHSALVKMNYHFADGVTTLGDFNKQWQLRLGAEEAKIQIAPNGVDPALFPKSRKQGGERLVVLTMARIYPLKGIEYLLRAAAQVRSRIPSILFRILGEVADSSYYQRCLRIRDELALENNVEFGSTKDPASVFADADVFCLPSISEGMPYSILEAMFSRCPVVATEVGNIPEMLGSTGLLVPPANVESLARALLSLLDGKDEARDYRQAMARAAEERARSLYTMEKAIGAYRHVYQALTNEKHASKLYIAAAR
jgi:glycosyltransferase involved in cell wall biosynthesis